MLSIKKYFKNCICVCVALFVAYSSQSLANDLQVVSVSNSGSVSPGQQFTLDINYDVSTGDNNLTGLGLNIHYDSSKLTFVQVSDYIVKDNIINGIVSADTSDSDNNPNTDRLVNLAWVSLNGDWPNTSLPANLLNIDFVVANDLDEQTTLIGFSSASNASGFGFSGDNYELQISSATATWDIDLNGEADALTDGLLLLRHTFGLSGEALVNNAVATNSPLSSLEVEENIATSTSKLLFQIFECRNEWKSNIVKSRQQSPQANQSLQQVNGNIV